MIVLYLMVYLLMGVLQRGVKDSGSTYVYTYLKLQAGSPGYSIHLGAAINVLELQLKSPTRYIRENASLADRGLLWLF